MFSLILAGTLLIANVHEYKTEKVPNIQKYLIDESSSNSRLAGGTPCDTRKGLNTDFMMSLRQWKSKKKYYKHGCAGTLIAKFWILTAAHCCHYSKVTRYAVQSNKVDKNEYTGKVTKVISMIPHYKYNQTTCENDIALMKLKTAITAKVIQLPTKIQNNILPAKEAIVIGFNTMKTGKFGLMCLDRKLLTLPECKKEYGTQDFIVTSGNLCTNDDKKFGNRKFDSGGPLFKNNIQYGIVSWGNAKDGKPTVFARIDMFLYFLQKEMEDKNRATIHFGLFNSKIQWHLIFMWLTVLILK